MRVVFRLVISAGLVAVLAEFIDAAFEMGEPAVLIRALSEVARMSTESRSSACRYEGCGHEPIRLPSSHPRGQFGAGLHAKLSIDAPCELDHRVRGDTVLFRHCA